MAIITAKINDADKADFDRFCSDVGMTASTAINLYVKAVLRENRIPFEITDEEPNDITYQAMEAAEHGDVVGPFDSVDDLMRSLDA